MLDLSFNYINSIILKNLDINIQIRIYRQGVKSQSLCWFGKEHKKSLEFFRGFLFGHLTAFSVRCSDNIPDLRDLGALFYLFCTYQNQACP